MGAAPCKVAEGGSCGHAYTNTWHEVPAQADCRLKLVAEGNGSRAAAHLHFTHQMVFIGTLTSIMGGLEITARRGAAGEVARIAQFAASALAATGNAFPGNHVVVFAHSTRGSARSTPDLRGHAAGYRGRSRWDAGRAEASPLDGPERATREVAEGTGTTVGGGRREQQPVRQWGPESDDPDEGSRALESTIGRLPP